MVAQLDEFAALAHVVVPARMRQIDIEDFGDLARARPQQHDAVRQQHRLVDAVGDEDDDALVAPAGDCISSICMNSRVCASRLANGSSIRR